MGSREGLLLNIQLPGAVTTLLGWQLWNCPDRDSYSLAFCFICVMEIALNAAGWVPAGHKAEALRLLFPIKASCFNEFFIPNSFFKVESEDWKSYLQWKCSSMTPEGAMVLTVSHLLLLYGTVRRSSTCIIYILYSASSPQRKAPKIAFFNLLIAQARDCSNISDGI